MRRIEVSSTVRIQGAPCSTAPCSRFDSSPGTARDGQGRQGVAGSECGVPGRREMHHLRRSQSLP